MPRIELSNADTVKEWLVAGAVFLWPLETPQLGYLVRDVDAKRLETAIVSKCLLYAILDDLKAIGWRQCEIEDQKRYFLIEV